MQRRHRRLISLLCIAAALLLPLGAQLHALGHALAALHEATTGQSDQGAPPTACDECLLFASLGGALPAHAAPLPIAAPGIAEALPAALPARAEPFSAYACRGPPRIG